MARIVLIHTYIPPYYLVEQLLPSFTIFGVLSKNNVSLGDILVKTTFCIDDFPLLQKKEMKEMKLYIPVLRKTEMTIHIIQIITVV